MFPWQINLPLAIGEFALPFIPFFLLIAGMQMGPDLIARVRDVLGLSVVSVRGLKPLSDPDLIYVGRRAGGWNVSPLGNPFHIGTDGDRPQVIEKYRHWLRGEVRRGNTSPAAREVTRVATLIRQYPDRKIKIGCWCAPDACHGDVVANAIAYEYVRDLSPEEIERQFGTREK